MTEEAPIRISFEAGMARLEEISRELDSGEVPLDRTIELMKEGKGLEQALRAHLDQAAERLSAIEQGEMRTLYEIVSISEPPAAAQEPAADPRDLPRTAPAAQDDLFGAGDEPV